jgi:hypothetical protein
MNNILFFSEMMKYWSRSKNANRPISGRLLAKPVEDQYQLSLSSEM